MEQHPHYITFAQGSALLVYPECQQNPIEGKEARRNMSYPERMKADIGRVIDGILLQVTTYSTLEAEADVAHKQREIERAVQEAVRNAFQHAHLCMPQHPIEVTWSIVGDTCYGRRRDIFITVTDQGDGYDYAATPQTPEEAFEKMVETGNEGGLGLVSYIGEGVDASSPYEDGNAVVMQKNIGPELEMDDEEQEPVLLG